MSSAKMLAIWTSKNQYSMSVLETFQNSWTIFYQVWEEVAEKYLPLERGSPVNIDNQIWGKFHKADMPDHVRAVLRMTYDYALIERKNYLRAAEDIAKYRAEFPNHGQGSGLDTIEKVFDCEPDCEFVGFWITTVSENLWNPEHYKDKKVPLSKVFMVYK